MRAASFVGYVMVLAFVGHLSVAKLSGIAGSPEHVRSPAFRAAPAPLDLESIGASNAAAQPRPRRSGRTHPPLSHSVQDIDNGKIRVRLNDYAPIVTHMWVDGELAVPHDNIGADFQMAARSDKGDGYNPTQGGDCSGARSFLNTVILGWNAVTGDATARHGVMFEIEPRNYNEPRYPGCLGPGEYLPYDMRFGLTLGDGLSMPKELMLVEMGIVRRPNTTAEPIVKALSELPVLYLDNARYRYAYFSTDMRPADGMSFQPLRAQGTHDTRAWDALNNHPAPEPARSIMLCDRADAVQSPGAGRCIALYAHYALTVQASRRQGAIYDLTSITTIPIDSVEPRIEDHVPRVERRLLAVGTPATVSSAIAWGAVNVPESAWRRW